MLIHIHCKVPSIKCKFGGKHHYRTFPSRSVGLESNCRNLKLTLLKLVNLLFSSKQQALKATLNGQASTNDIGIVVLPDTIKHSKKTFTSENQNINFSIVFSANSRRQDLEKKQHKNNRVVAEAFQALLSFSLPFSKTSKSVHILLCYK